MLSSLPQTMPYLRKLGADDVMALAMALRDLGAEDHLYFSGLGEPRVSADDWMAWRNAEAERGEAINFAGFNENGELLGEVTLTNYRTGHASLSYWIRRSFRKKGFGFGMASTLCHYGFSNCGLNCIEVEISPFNISSHRLAHRLGAKHVSVTNNTDRPVSASMNLFHLFWSDLPASCELITPWPII